jgi:Protein of unknown function (DUF2852)
MRCCGFGFGRPHGRTDDRSEPRAWWSQPTSGNRAFDEYRADTLRRLEQEQHEFLDFLARLRSAKDKTEFDQFMTELRTPAKSSAA